MNDPNLITSAVLVIAPVIAFLVSFLGIFDLKYKEAKEWFEKLSKEIRERKIENWRYVINGADGTSINDDYVEAMIKKMEEVDLLQRTLRKCRSWFHFYYMSLLVIFVGGVLHGFFMIMSQIDLLAEFTNKYQGFIISFTILYVTFGFASLFIKKLLLEKKYEKFIEV